MVFWPNFHQFIIMYIKEKGQHTFRTLNLRIPVASLINFKNSKSRKKETKLFDSIYLSPIVRKVSRSIKNYVSHPDTNRKGLTKFNVPT